MKRSGFVWQLAGWTAVLLSTDMASRTMAQTQPIPTAINQTGLDLLRAQRSGGTAANELLSPYSITSALVMAFVGADGDTRSEMRRVLHLPADDETVLAGSAELQRQLTDLQEESRRRVEEESKHGGGGEPIAINVANRLFAQTGFALRPAYVDTVRDRFGAPVEELDFRHAVEPSRLRINAWVAEQTRDKIRDLIPSGLIGADTRVVLTNAIHLKAPWADAFSEENTKLESFWIGGTAQADVPTMGQRENYRYEHRNGYAALALPYRGGQLQFVILLPDQRDGLARLEQNLDTASLASCASLSYHDVILHLPKFKLEPASVPLGELLRGLGMTTAFDRPPGSANFDRMAPRKPDDYLAISEVVHKAWLSLDEKGTEAAAATAVVMFATTAAPGPKPQPIEVRVDRPFLFAIQHVPSATCLFLGRVVDPR